MRSRLGLTPSLSPIWAPLLGEESARVFFVKASLSATAGSAWKCWNPFPGPNSAAQQYTVLKVCLAYNMYI